MSIESSYAKGSQHGGCRDTEVETATQKTIRQIREGYCEKLRTLTGGLNETELGNEGAQMQYEKKKCSFVKTEKNYLLVRNLELKVGLELMQASEEIKKNVAGNLEQNTALVLALKAVVKTAKDTKTIFGDLRDAASKLDACMKDSCNAVQMKILGCKDNDCNDTKQEVQERKPDCCQNVCEILDELVTVPDEFSADIDIIFSSSAEIVGIQSFANIKTLEQFQLDFSANAKAFDDLVLSQITAGGISLKKAQDDLTAAIRTLTQSGYALYGKRDEVNTADDTKDYLCCHECKCIGDCGCGGERKEGENRFKNCKSDICEICNEVTGIYYKLLNSSSSC